MPWPTRALYLYADRQRDNLDTIDLPRGKRIGPLFGNYRFESPDETLRVWRGWNNVMRYVVDHDYAIRE